MSESSNEPARPNGSVYFDELSPTAQDFIVRAAMGEFNLSPPKDMPEEVKAEIRRWAYERPTPNAGGDR